MTNSNSTKFEIDERHQQLRKVAIFVDTLDGALAERLLSDLPAREAIAVRQIVEQLGEIDAAERQAVVADFHQGIAEPPHPPVIESPQLPTNNKHEELDGVELDDSLLARLSEGEDAYAQPTTLTPATTWQTLSEADGAMLVEMLSAEQPQTIAVVLSKLDSTRAAELVGKLSPNLQADVLARLVDLDPADEQTLHVVESQLASWINAQRQRRERMTAGRDMVQRILQHTPSHQRTVLMEKLEKRNLGLAEPLGASRVTTPSVAVDPVNARKEAQPTTSPLPVTPASLSQEIVATCTDDPLSELEALDDRSLLNALRMADRQTVMLALVGASEGLMKRIVRSLPRRQANQFRQQVRSIGPARLSDMLAAQRELVRCGQA